MTEYTLKTTKYSNSFLNLLACDQLIMRSVCIILAKQSNTLTISLLILSQSATFGDKGRRHN